MIQLPIILFGFILMKKNKKKKRLSNRSSSIDISELPNDSGDNENRFNFNDSAIDESDLIITNPSEEESGFFEIEEEDISINDGEKFEKPIMKIIETPTMTCDDFIEAIHVRATDENEIPINKIAVEQTIIPVMQGVLDSISNESKFIDADTVAPIMIEEALNELIPICKWKFDNNNYEFTYNDGETINSPIGKDVIYGLMKISSILIENFNDSLMPDLEFQTEG